jgi:hypothetical protein
MFSSLFVVEAERREMGAIATVLIETREVCLKLSLHRFMPVFGFSRLECTELSGL